MAFFKGTAVFLIALMAVAVCSAQKFPERSGEWTASMPDPMHAGGPPMTMLFCLNDELWTKALTQNPSCTISQVNITASGGSYALDCPMKAIQMKGIVKMTFAGTTHIVSNAALDSTINGKTSHMESTTDFRWKGPTCDPNVDMNLRNHNLPPPPH
jgi:hypothetical protein